MQNQARILVVVVSAATAVITACIDASPSRQIAAPDATLSAALASESDYVTTPNGKFHKTCVHELPSQARVDLKGNVLRPDGSSFQLPKCQFPLPPRRNVLGKGVSTPSTNGWQEYAYAYTDASLWGYSPVALFYLAASWKVPPNPVTSYSTANKVYYTFPGIEPPDGSNILQPVLQYGNNGSYGGAYWTMTVWTCGWSTGWGCAHSSPTTVFPGDSLKGFIRGTGACSGYCSNWLVQIDDVTRGTGRAFNWGDTLHYTIAFGGVVETYALNNCNEFPGSGPTFTGVEAWEYPLTSSPDYNNWGPQLAPTWYSNV